MIETSKHIINVDWCKGCGICVAFCPKSVLILEKTKVKVEDLEMCIQCSMCERLCPDYAISIKKKENRK